MMADFNNNKRREMQRSWHDDRATPDDQQQPHNYQILGEIGRGSFGVVYRAVDRTARELVAIKEARSSRSAHLTAEAKILTTLWHENIVNLKNIICASVSGVNGSDSSALVLELGYCDFVELLEDYWERMAVRHIKSVIQQFLEGLNYIHGQGIIHRDLKPDNIMLTDYGIVKITDFGLARFRSTVLPGKCFTPHIGTRIFQSPELLLGTTRYTSAIDMWAAGLTVFELFFRTRLFPARSTKEGVLEEIALLLGTIDQTTVSERLDLPDLNLYNLPRNDCSRFIEKLFRHTNDGTVIQLLIGLLRLNPDTRFSALTALCQPFFRCDPMPEKFIIRNLPGYPTSPPYPPPDRQSSSHSTPPLVIDCPGTSSPGSVPEIAHEVIVETTPSSDHQVSATSSLASSDDHVSDTDVVNEVIVQNILSPEPISPFSLTLSNDDEVHQASPTVETEPKVIVEQIRPAPDYVLPPTAFSALIMCDEVNHMASSSNQSSHQPQNIPPEPQLAKSVVFNHRHRQHHFSRVQPLSPLNGRYHPYFSSN